MKKFEVGKTYTTRSIGDHGCIIAVTVARRTAKTITDINGKRLGVFEYDGQECVMPWGRYSMAPTIRAGGAL